ncbi:MAG: PQQ-dependent sugar dehydrogenase [Planctomycetia bacterium]|jgi:glucose/arabinose dehydrogenase|nr:PQQ-dependent sugar dehydrogenase [Planctomycetia bacterium]MCC7316536.1 PQQ-dependent sugar dehydrogenase [Planctomycetota bacterium]
MFIRRPGKPGNFVRGLAILTAICASAATLNAAVQPGSITVNLDPVATGLVSPTDLTSPNDGSGRLFITDQNGRIRIVDGGTLLPTPFLNLTSSLPMLAAGFDERGLLGMAFHPDYSNNGRFFVRYSAPRPGAPGEPCFGTSRGCHEERLSEFAVDPMNANLANPASERILFRVDEPQFNHNGGDLEFGPDGFLYFGLGDGGGAHDGLADVPPSHGPIGNGQNTNVLLGKILRIDVNGPPAMGLEYAIPAGNPFAAGPGLDEIYAYGFRNPFKLSFDDGPGGDGSLLVADVGQNLFEEIDRVQNGGNYGWVTREGFHCFDPLNPTTPPAMCSSTGAGGEPLLDPIAEYDHTDGISVIGGFVYRGSLFPELVGKYIFGDFSTSFATPAGRLFYIDIEGDPSQIFEFINGPMDLPLGLFVKGFGEDANGEIYLLASTLLGPIGTGGQVLHVTPEPATLGALLLGAALFLRRRRRS